MLDEHPGLIDHVGWRLWRAARAWKAEFDARMAEAGFGWFTEARSGLLASVGAKGASQAALAEALGVSKQAVQQMVDELVAEGAVRRVTDERDARVRVVVLTPKGVAAARAANEAKRAIEADYRRRLGGASLKALREALAAIAPER